MRSRVSLRPDDAAGKSRLDIMRLVVRRVCAFLLLIGLSQVIVVVADFFPFELFPYGIEPIDYLSITCAIALVSYAFLVAARVFASRSFPRGVLWIGLIGLLPTLLLAFAAADYAFEWRVLFG